MFQPSPAARRGRSPIVALLAALCLLSGCVIGPRIVTPEPPPIPEGGPAIPESNEAVLADGTQVVAKAPWGRIKIEAGPGLRRVYTWRGNRRGVILKPRTQRFAGSMGIHYEGAPPQWEAADGVTQVDLEEGQRRFETVDDAMIWMQIRRLRYGYTNDGLVVGWRIKGDTLMVELWQFYIDGKKPTSLPNADNTRIATGPLEVVPQKMTPQLIFADGRTEPYTTETASRYARARAGGASSASTSECNWFQRLLRQCTAAAADSETETETVAAADSAPAVDSPAASSGLVGSSVGEQPAPEAAERIDKAEIEGKVVNIRDRPSTDSEVLTQARQGDSVAILKEEGGWSYVRFDDSRKGWVADFLLKH